MLKGLRPEIPKNIPDHFVKIMESRLKEKHVIGLHLSFRSVME